MKSCGDVFIKYGGHELAAGFTISPENISELDKALNVYAAENMSEDAKTPFITVDFELPAKYITVDDITNLRLLEPFGVSNPKPCFMCSGARIVNKRLMGDKGQHIKLSLTKDGTSFEAVAFRRPDINEKYAVNDYITVIGSLTVNEWNNTSTPQLIISDILPPPEAYQDAPDRDSLKVVYTHLKGFDKSFWHSVSYLATTLSMSTKEILNCLDFFSKTGVAEYNLNGDKISVNIIK